MEIFISWSRPLARDVAIALREWLPVIFDGVRPFASTRDIDSGTRWAAEIKSHLDVSQFGIIIVTKENQDQPWLNFEAGALSKQFDKAVEPRVVPLLIDFEDAGDLSGPLVQFQARVFNQDNIRLLVLEINRALQTPATVSALDKRFDTFWPELRASIDKATSEAAKRASDSQAPDTGERSERDMLHELLSTVRGLSRATPPASSSSSWVTTALKSQQRSDETHTPKILRELRAAPNPEDRIASIIKKKTLSAFALNFILQKLREEDPIVYATRFPNADAMVRSYLDDEKYSIRDFNGNTWVSAPTANWADGDLFAEPTLEK